MAYAGIETTLELWASSLREVKARMRPLFTQERVAASAGRFLEVLLSDERRKTGWMRAEAGRSGGRSRSVASAGDPRARTLGRGGAAGYCAWVCAAAPGRSGRGAGGG